MMPIMARDVSYFERSVSVTSLSSPVPLSWRSVELECGCLLGLALMFMVVAASLQMTNELAVSESQYLMHAMCRPRLLCAPGQEVRNSQPRQLSD